MTTTILAGVGAVLLVLVGFVGIFAPFLPGVPLAWLGLLLFAAVTGFATISKLTVLILFGVVLLTFVFDMVAPIIGAKKYHASRRGIIGSTIGLLAGMIFFGPLGIILGPLIGAFVGELSAGKSRQDAMHSASGVFVGFLAGTLLKLIAILVIAGFLIAGFFS